MPPRRLPRSWLAGRLRSAAGAVQRLAGRVEPSVATGQRSVRRPSEVRTAAPRRFGEPPQHWLDLVAAHAPGLLQDLDLDVPPGGRASTDAADTDTGDGRYGWPGREDGAGPADRGLGGRTTTVGQGPDEPGHRSTADPRNGFGGPTGIPDTGGFEGYDAAGGLGVPGGAFGGSAGTDGPAAAGEFGRRDAGGVGEPGAADGSGGHGAADGPGLAGRFGVPCAANRFGGSGRWRAGGGSEPSDDPSDKGGGLGGSGHGTAGSFGAADTFGRGSSFGASDAAGTSGTAGLFGAGMAFGAANGPKLDGTLPARLRVRRGFDTAAGPGAPAGSTTSAGSGASSGRGGAAQLGASGVVGGMADDRSAASGREREAIGPSRPMIRPAVPGTLGSPPGTGPADRRTEHPRMALTTPQPTPARGSRESRRFLEDSGPPGGTFPPISPAGFEGASDEWDRGRFSAGGGGFSARPGGLEADKDGFGIGRSGFGAGGDPRGFGVGGGRLGGVSAAGGVPRGRGEGDGPAGWTGPAGTGPATGAGPIGVARAAGRGPWPALPDEPASPGQRAGEAEPGGSGPDLTSGGWSAVASGLWPALPDDRPLWTVPGEALDAAQLSRLDREQAGD